MDGKEKFSKAKRRRLRTKKRKASQKHQPAEKSSKTVAAVLAATDISFDPVRSGRTSQVSAKPKRKPKQNLSASAPVFYMRPTASTTRTAGQPHRVNYQDRNTTDEGKTGPLPDSFTENKAPTYKTTGDPRLDLFFAGIVRGRKRTDLYYMLRNSWDSSPTHTIALLLQGRDCRGGKGERDIITEGFIWLRMHYPKTYALNLPNLLGVGCYRDLLTLASKVYRYQKVVPRLNPDLIELEIFHDHILDDEKALSAAEEKETHAKLSLAAKWAPTAKCFFDKEDNGRLAKKLRILLFPNDDHGAHKYRKLLTKLRTHLKVVEQLLCAGRWQDIQFGMVPSKAHRIYRKCFVKHQEERYSQYLADVKSNKEKINTTGTMPHELVSPFIKSPSTDDETLELQWKTLIEKLTKAGNINGGLAVVDVSGSMTGQPMEVAIALGLVLCSITSDSWKNQVISFTAEPTWHTVAGDTLREKVSSLKQMAWGMSTNFNAVFEMILQRATQEGIPDSDMPSTVFVFSDMHFDAAGASGETNFQQIKRRFEAKGFSLPQLLFWNLKAGEIAFPVHEGEENVALISGFSSDLMHMFLDGGELSSVAVMLRAIEPYIQRVNLDPSEVSAADAEAEGK